MMQLPAGATGFFEAGTFREPIQRGEFLQLVYQLARENRCTVGETNTSLCGKTFMPHKSSETVEQKFCS